MVYSRAVGFHMPLLKAVLSREFWIFTFMAASFAVTAPGQIVPSQATDSGLGGTNSVTGSVLAPGGARIERPIQVRLVTMTKGDRVAMTDETGNFAFRGLISGSYSILIEKEKEFEPFSQSFEIIQLRGSPPQTYSLSIRLKSKKSIDAKPEVIDSALAGVPKQALTFYKKALDLAKAGDHKGAIEQLKFATAEYPNFMIAFNEMGVEYLRLNELEQADEAYRAALKIDPEAYAPLMNRGMVLFQMKRFTEAEPVLRKATTMKGDAAVGHYFLGQTLANLGYFDEAEKELVLAVMLGGDTVKEAHRILAIIYSSKGNKKKAIVELETYLKLAPLAPDAEELRETIRQYKDSDPKPYLNVSL